AQFTVQPTKTYGEQKTNIKRITLDSAYTGPITYMMNWTNAKEKVTFSVYYGTYTISEAKLRTPNITWDEAPVKYIPNSTFQTFHLNLWQGSWKFKNKYDHAQPTSVTVTRFQYEK